MPYASNDIHRISVAADLKQVVALKFDLLCSKKYNYRATALVCTSPKAKILAQITYKYVKHRNRQKGHNFMLVGQL